MPEKIGFVGVGRMGANMARRLHETGFPIVAVFDANAAAAQSLAAELGGVAAEDLKTLTALAEVIFHKTVEYQEIDYFHDSVSYQALLADFSSEFHDIRDDPAFADCLDPSSYIASQALAESLLELGSMGIVYPSARQAGGINLACFRPALVGNVRRAAAYQLSWSGTPEAQVRPLPR